MIESIKNNKIKIISIFFLLLFAILMISLGNMTIKIIGILLLIALIIGFVVSLMRKKKIFLSASNRLSELGF